MYRITVTLESISPYSQSKFVDAEKLNKETPADYDKRTWRLKAEYDDEGFAIVNRMAIKASLSEGAKYSGEKIPGGRGTTWTKFFERAVMVEKTPRLGPTRETIEGMEVDMGCVFPKNRVPMEKETILCTADGKPGGKGAKVPRIFPVFRRWGGNVEIVVLDDKIKPEKLVEFLNTAGMFIGIGRWRPENRGLYGRFRVVGEPKVEVITAI